MKWNNTIERINIRIGYTEKICELQDKTLKYPVRKQR